MRLVKLFMYDSAHNSKGQKKKFRLGDIKVFFGMILQPL